MAMKIDLVSRLPARDPRDGPVLDALARRALLRFSCGVAMATALVLVPLWLWAGPFSLVGTVAGVILLGLAWSAFFLTLRGAGSLAAVWLAAAGPRKAAVQLGAAVILVAAAQFVWLVFGWSTFHPRCDDGATLFSPSRPQELLGPLRPEAADAFEAAFVRVWGAGAVRRSAPGEVRLRPALELFAGDFLHDLTQHIAADERRRRDVPLPDGFRACRDTAIALMAHGGAAPRSGGWSGWPYAMIDERGDLARWLVGLSRGSGGPQ